MATAVSRWGLLLLANFVVWGIVGCAPSSSDPNSTSTPETSAATEDVGTPSGPAETPLENTQSGGGDSDSGTTTSETTTGDEGEAGHSHLIPHAGGDTQGETVLTQLQGDRKFVRTGEFLGCVDVDCQTLVIFTGWTVELIDATSGHLKTSYALPEQMRHAQLSQGNVIVTDYDRPARVYSLELSTGKQTPVCAIPFYVDLMSVSTQYVAFATKEESDVQIRSLQTPNQNILTLIHPAKITGVVLSDEYAVASDHAGGLGVWKVPSGEVIVTEQDVGSITAMALQGTEVAYATFDPILAVSTLVVYDLQQKKTVHRALVKEGNEVTVLSWANQQVLYGIGDQGRGGVWNLNTSKVEKFTIDPVGNINHIVVSSSHWIIDHGFSGHSISFFTPTRTLWGSLQLQLEKTLTFHWSRGGPIALAGDILLTGFGPMLKFWNIPTGTEIPEKAIDIKTYIDVVVVSGNRVAIAGSSRIDVLELMTGNLIHDLQGADPRIRRLAMDGNHLVAGFDNFEMRIWNTETGALVGGLQGHADRITALAISNGILASASVDNTLRVWDLTAQQPLKVITEPDSFIRALDISGDYIAYRHYEKFIIRNWKTEDPPLIHDFIHDSYGESSVSIMDPWVITCGREPVLRVWNLKTGELVKAFATTSTTCALDRSRTDVIRLAGTNGYSVEVLEIDPKTLEGRALASDAPQQLIPRRIFRVSEPSREFKVHVVDHRSWFRRTWQRLRQWIQKIF